MMKLNYAALLILSSICLVFPNLSPTYAIPHEVTKRGEGHHEHGTLGQEQPFPEAEETVAPSPTDESPQSSPLQPEEEHSQADVSHPMAEGEGHHEHHEHHEHHDGMHGGASSPSPHGGAHGDHGGMMDSEPWFHHGGVEISDVFHAALMDHAGDSPVDEARADEAEDLKNRRENHGESGVETIVMDTNQMTIPSVTLVVHPDTRSGWNIEVQTEHFAFAPEQVNQVNRPNVGHGHLYVNGEKLTRLYSNWFYIDHLEAGSNEITVSLHANGHEVWTHEGEAIADSATVEVP